MKKKGFNPLPNDKILDGTKLMALADNKINLIQNLNFLLERLQNIVGKGENAGYQHFLLFYNFSGVVYLGGHHDRVVELKNSNNAN